MAIATPHDALFKSCLSKPQLAREFLEIYLPQSIKAICELGTLQVEPSSFVDPSLRQYHSDILYSLEIAGSTGYVFVLLEHQRKPDKFMAFRMFHYQMLLMKRHFDQYNALPIIVPMVFYQGTQSPYPYALEIEHCFDHPELAKNLFKTFKLIDLSVISDQDIKKHQSIALFEMAQKHIFARDLLTLILNLKEILLKNTTQQTVIEDVIKYLFINKNKEDYDLIVETFSQQPNVGDETMTTIAEHLMEQGWEKGMKSGVQQGLEKGLEQGRKEEAILIAKNLIQMGLDKVLIQKATELSDQEIQQLLTDTTH